MENGKVKKALSEEVLPEQGMTFFWDLDLHYIEMKYAKTIVNCQLGLIALTRFI